MSSPQTALTESRGRLFPLARMFRSSLQAVRGSSLLERLPFMSSLLAQEEVALQDNEQMMGLRPKEAHLAQVEHTLHIG